MESAAPPRPLQIGDWIFDPAAGELRGSAGARVLEPKCAQLLALLAREPGALVARENLLQALWPRVVVGEDSLAKVVSKLRQALGDAARSPRYVETLSRRGLRLIAPVRMLVAGSAVDAGSVSGEAVGNGDDADGRADGSGGGLAPATDTAASAHTDHGAPVRGVADVDTDGRATGDERTHTATPASDTALPPSSPLRRSPGRPSAAALTAAVAVAAVLAAALVWRSLPSPAPTQAPIPAPAFTQTQVPAQEKDLALREILSRADDHYFQYSRDSLESARVLYERVLALQPQDTAALAGLANTLVQHAIRWTRDATGQTQEFHELGAARANGHLDREPAATQLRRARQLAERAVELAPADAGARRALGLALAAQGHYAVAIKQHARAVALDPMAWGAMINLADALALSGDSEAALPWLERAFRTMDTAYAREAARVRPWQTRLGLLIAERHRAAGRPAAAEAWLREVLARDPLDEATTETLAQLLRAAGDEASAERLMAEFRERTGRTPDR